MRYQNWDVLLFPDGSKTPMQEFKTQCQVAKDYDSPFLHNPSFNGMPYVTDGKPLTQLPVLTTFVGSLMQNASFRVSIHSWERPKPSRIMESLIGPEDSIRFEARIYLDGVLVADSVFNQRTAWPHVIDTSDQMDKEGNYEALKFPPFHKEILQQAHWDAGELLGRIRVIIAEGYARSLDPPQYRRIPSFERFKDVVVFSFQHAPLNILEFSAIAWPNPGMWKQASGRPIVPPPPIGYRPYGRADEDAHAHSPRRAAQYFDEAGLRREVPNMRGSRGAMYELSPSNHTKMAPSRPTTDFMIPDDPFSDIQKGTVITRRWGARHSVEDVAMPDYVSSSAEESSRALSNMTGVSYEQKPPGTMLEIFTDAAIDEFVKTLSPAKKDQLIKVLSPTKAVGTGTQAPANTPSSDSYLLAKPSAASQARFASYAGVESRKCSGITEVPDSAMATQLLVMMHEGSGLLERKLSASPAGSLQSRKEAAKHDKGKEKTREIMESSVGLGQGAALDINIGFPNATDPSLVSSDSKCNASSETKKRLLDEMSSPSLAKKALRKPSGQNHSPADQENVIETGSKLRKPLAEIRNVD